jgi:hypothetical protein
MIKTSHTRFNRIRTLAYGSGSRTGPRVVSSSKYGSGERLPQVSIPVVSVSRSKKYWKAFSYSLGRRKIG